MHKSIMRRNSKGKPVNNERLEFLGDAVLDAVVGDIVYQHFPGKREGFLTNTRSKLVQRDTLNKLAQEMGINQLIYLTDTVLLITAIWEEMHSKPWLVPSIWTAVMTHACFHEESHSGTMINIDKVAYKEVNFKSKLIEWSQKTAYSLNMY